MRGNTIGQRRGIATGAPPWRRPASPPHARALAPGRRLARAALRLLLSLGIGVATAVLM
ncbi:MAG: hypothetical protein R2708_01730 [Vicinamibacterales bacterium]